MDNKLVKVLTKNSVKCLLCNTILESKHRHDFVMCPCPNHTTCDGGLEYQRTLAVDLDLIEFLVNILISLLSINPLPLHASANINSLSFPL